MKFSSFHARVNAILVTTAISLFLVLALIMSLFFRTAVDSIMRDLERPRMLNIFAELDQRFDENSTPEEITAYLETLYLEFNLGVYDRSKQLITALLIPGSEVEFDNILVNKVRMTGFVHVYYNPNPESRFYALKIDVRIPDKPVLKLMIILTLIAIGIVFGVFYYVSLRLGADLNRRLERLKNGVSQVASGNFDVDLDESGKDEIAFLAHSFNLMSKKIKNLVTSLQESNEVRQRMFAHASHEIKSPLTSIKGFVDIIEYTDVLPEEQQRNLLPAVKKDINRVIKITNDILQLARLRDPGFQLDIQAVDLASLLREEHGHFAGKAESRDVRSRLEIDARPPLLCRTDPDRLAQVLDNLWNNALKYGDTGRPITTRLSLEHNIARIEISNFLRAPIDVPLARLFEPFYRNPATADRITGSGLGLVIVKELVEKLGGRIEAHSEELLLRIVLYLPQGNGKTPRFASAP